MATLDDKLLGEKLHYYCSSSEDEGEGSDDEGGRKEKAGAGASSEGVAPQGQAWDGSSANTGPKGVLKDWQRYKQLETEMREEAELERLALAKKLALTCKSDNDEKKDNDIDKELEELLEDPYLESYMQQRMKEMMERTQNTTKMFGSVIELTSGQSFLDHIEKEDSKVIVIILVYDPAVEGCQAMAGCIDCLAKEYRNVKFCKILPTASGFPMSKQFKSSGLPALVVHRAGQSLGTFVRMTDQLGDDFYANDVESFLLEHGMLPSKEEIPAIIRGPATNKNDDSDDD